MCGGVRSSRDAASVPSLGGDGAPSSPLRRHLEARGSLLSRRLGSLCAPSRPAVQFCSAAEACRPCRCPAHPAVLQRQAPPISVLVRWRRWLLGCVRPGCSAPATVPIAPTSAYHCPLQSQAVCFPAPLPAQFLLPASRCSALLPLACRPRIPGLCPSLWLLPLPTPIPVLFTLSFLHALLTDDGLFPSTLSRPSPPSQTCLTKDQTQQHQHLSPRRERSPATPARASDPQTRMQPPHL